MHRNRQVSLSFLFLLFCAIVTAQTEYGTIPNLPDFENAIPISNIPLSELDSYYSQLPDNQVWFAKKIENWNEFFSTNESIEVNFYYQKDASSPLILESEFPIFKIEPWHFKVQHLGLFYVVLKSRGCYVVLKYWRHPNGICQYQDYDCET